MKSDERVIYFYDLAVTARTEHANLPPVRSLLEVIAAERAAGRFRTAGDRAGNLWHFLGPIEFDEDNQTATILIRSSDKRSPEYGYSNVNDGTLRLLEKDNHEGGDAAAHLVVSLLPADPDTYIAVLEGVSGLSHRNVISLFNNLLTAFYANNPSHFTYPDPAGAKTRNGDIKRHEVKPKFKLIGHISDQLHQDIENGTIGDIELRNGRVNSTIGNDPFIRSKSFRLTLSVQADIPKANVLERLVTAIQSKHATYDRAKIHFVDQTGHPKTVEIDVTTGAVEQSYVQARRISAVFPPLRMTTDVILSRVSDPMKEMLIEYRG
ncbi:hypothetical protein HH800_04625 [Sphingobium yanoikuyae]|uniref:Uncharacterized protein n=1 Tax=Sphingobium yanoikuyae TaxID=13690 RepID=A0A6M4G3T0_SPHYA|nr:hypothetical protein [Sphingobium yanoikuyae]QJR01546.1 hypothetical protein HH800_04625 [Sphingobium yanoikuyae]